MNTTTKATLATILAIAAITATATADDLQFIVDFDEVMEPEGDQSFQIFTGVGGPTLEYNEHLFNFHAGGDWPVLVNEIADGQGEMVIRSESGGNNNGNGVTIRLPDGLPFSLHSFEYDVEITRGIKDDNPSYLSVRSDRGRTDILAGAGTYEFSGPDWEDLTYLSLSASAEGISDPSDRIESGIAATIDNIAVSAAFVPEPSAWVLLVSAIVLFWRARG